MGVAHSHEGAHVGQQIDPMSEDAPAELFHVVAEHAWFALPGKQTKESTQRVSPIAPSASFVFVDRFNACRRAHHFLSNPKELRLSGLQRYRGPPLS
jgi:hypothetical protein